MNEKFIQKAIYRLFDNHSYKFTNIYFFNNGEESDFLSFTKTGYTNEVEVKISRSDFKADFKKAKHEQMKQRNDVTANRFYFAVPDGLIKPEEVPEYAGLIYIGGNYILPTIIKNAPLLHKNKHSLMGAWNKAYYTYEASLKKILFEND